MEKQYGFANFKIEKVHMFKFNRGRPNDMYIELDFKRELEGGWNFALLLGTKVSVCPNSLRYIAVDVGVFLCSMLVPDHSECHGLHPDRA